MGSKLSKQKPLCIQLKLYNDNIFANNYVITNYNSQIHRFPNGKAINFKFIPSIDRPNSFMLHLRYDDNITIDNEHTYKEGDTLYIKILLSYERIRESSHITDLHDHTIPWHKELKYIHVSSSRL